MRAKCPFIDRLADRHLILYDGGFGAELFARGIQLTNSTLANELHPNEVIAVHKAFIQAGSEVIGTNTFVASSLHMDMAGKDAKDADQIARLAVSHALAAAEACQAEVYVAGSIGPSPGAIEADAGGVDFGIANDKVRESHRRIAQTMAEGGVDLLCLETMFSAKEAAIAVDEARQTGLPIAVNMTYKYTKDRATATVVYKTDWGHSPADLIDILASGEFSDGDDLLPHVQILGLNCGAEARRAEHSGMPYAINGTLQLRQALRERGLDKKMMAYPNAGMPRLDENHLTYYSQTADEMRACLPDLLAAGAYVVGGCCGTTPGHIATFRQAMVAADAVPIGADATEDGAQPDAQQE